MRPTLAANAETAGLMTLPAVAIAALRYQQEGNVATLEGSLLDVLRAFRQQLGVALIKLDVVLRCRATRAQ
jgi:hypothetical protein